MNNFENRLWASAVQAAREAGMEFTVPCSRNMGDLIGAGVAAMRRENRLSEDDLEAAAAGLARLLEKMVRVPRDVAEPASPGGKEKIRETALVGAKELCPIWPFG
jgi:hypothetical protein